MRSSTEEPSYSDVLSCNIGSGAVPLPWLAAFFSKADKERCFLRRAALDPLLLAEVFGVTRLATMALNAGGDSEGSSGSKNV